MVLSPKVNKEGIQLDFPFPVGATSPFLPIKHAGSFWLEVLILQHQLVEHLHQHNLVLRLDQFLPGIVGIRLPDRSY